MKASTITSVDFFNDLTSPYARKRFFWGFIAIVLLCVLAIYLVHSLLSTGAVQHVAETVAIHILADSVIILAFYVLYMHLIGPNEGLAEIAVTRPQDIQERMRALPANARHYMFWGRSGSYFRSNPLLELDKAARENKRITDIEVVLPDPTDDRLIKSYREILVSLGESPDENPLLAHILATSIACAIINANNKYLRIRLFYSRFLPAFRVDLSDNGAILTQDDPAKSALFFDPQSEFFEMLRTTVRNEISVSREAQWSDDLFSGRKLDEKCCDKDTLNAFGITVTNVDDLQQRVADLITQRRHRYK